MVRREAVGYPEIPGRTGEDSALFNSGVLPEPSKYKAILSVTAQAAVTKSVAEKSWHASSNRALSAARSSAGRPEPFPAHHSRACTAMSSASEILLS